MTLKRYLLVVVVGFCAITALVMITTPSPDRMRADYVARFPDLASQFGHDKQMNDCIVDTSLRLRATRDDYASMAAQACQVAKQISH